MTLGEEAGGFGIGIGIGIGIDIDTSVATSELKCSTILCLTVLFADSCCLLILLCLVCEVCIL
jgi:hypothetical protein